MSPSGKQKNSLLCAVMGVVLALGAGGCDMSAMPEAGEIAVTVLVAYTSGTAAKAPDILSRAYRAIGETNAVYRNSGVHVALKIVRVMEVAYQPEEKLQALAHLVRPIDGVMDELHAARDAANADVVILLTEEVSFTQNAAIMAKPETAFVLVYYDHAGAPNYNIAHEVGHLQGARHQPERDEAMVPFPYGHATATAAWRTVVGTGRGLSVIPYFSSPALTYDGQPLGDTAQRNNVRVLNESAQYIANFRGPQRPTSFVPPATFPVLDF